MTDFLGAAQREDVTKWWLEVRQRANTPNWDIVSTCRFPDGPRGLVLIEAKAHAGELHSTGKAPGDPLNDEQVRQAIAEANTSLGCGWALAIDRNYQLCNRFAWAWKLASLGIPVVFVYLGFIDAEEMGRGRFGSADEWGDCVLTHAAGTIPADAWEMRMLVSDSWVIPVIRAARISATVVHPPEGTEYRVEALNSASRIPAVWQLGNWVAVLRLVVHGVDPRDFCRMSGFVYQAREHNGRRLQCFGSLYLVARQLSFHVIQHDAGSRFKFPFFVERQTSGLRSSFHPMAKGGD